MIKGDVVPVFEFGDIVVYSQKAIRDLRPHYKNRNRRGLITKVVTKASSYVVWEGNKTGNMYYNRFLKKRDV